MHGQDGTPGGNLPVPGVETERSPLTAGISRQWVARVLSAAVRLWLQSQVEQVDHLHVQIDGSDRQLLSGHIPLVQITAQNAIYKGLHLTDIALTGSHICINIGQILRGKPLRLLQVIPVTAHLQLSQTDFNASLQSALLSEAVTSLLQQLLCSALPDMFEGQSVRLHSPQLSLAVDQLTLSMGLQSAVLPAQTVALRTRLGLANGHTLQLAAPEWLPHPQAKRGLPLTDLDGFQINLGGDVQLQSLTLENEQLQCYGTINVRSDTVCLQE